MAVDHTANQLGQSHGLALGFASDIAEAVDQRHVGPVKVVGGRFDGGIESGRLAIDQRFGKQSLGRVVAEPGFAENAGILGFRDALTVGVQLDVVADAAAESARRILDHSQAHS